MLNEQNGETHCILIYWNGCKNSEKISWMTEFLNTETHTPVLLMKCLQSLRPREVWIWVNTVFNSFPWRPKLRDLSEDQNYKGPVQKTQRRSRTSSCKFWWLDNSRPQGPKWQLRVSKQSSIRSRGTGSSYSMDPGVSVQKQNFTRNPA